MISDDTIPVETLIDVVDECRMSGAKDVAVSTIKRDGIIYNGQAIILKREPNHLHLWAMGIGTVLMGSCCFI